MEPPKTETLMGRKTKPAEFQRVLKSLERRERDSNSRTSFAGHTLSRRASSATRASLLLCAAVTLGRVTCFTVTKSACKGTNKKREMRKFLIILTEIAFTDKN